MVTPVFAPAGAILAIGGHCYGACTVQIALGTVLRFGRYVCICTSVACERKLMNVSDRWQCLIPT